MEPVGLAELVEVLAAVHVLVGILGGAVDVGANVGALAPRLRVDVVRLVVLEAGVHAGRLVEQSGRSKGDCGLKMVRLKVRVKVVIQQRSSLGLLYIP